MKLVKRNISLLDLIALVAAIVLIVFFTLKGIIYFSIGSEELQIFAKEWQRQMLGIAVLVAFTPLAIFACYTLFVKGINLHMENKSQTCKITSLPLMLAFIEYQRAVEILLKSKSSEVYAPINFLFRHTVELLIKIFLPEARENKIHEIDKLFEKLMNTFKLNGNPIQQDEVTITLTDAQQSNFNKTCKELYIEMNLNAEEVSFVEKELDLKNIKFQFNELSEIIKKYLWSKDFKNTYFRYYDVKIPKEPISLKEIENDFIKLKKIVPIVLLILKGGLENEK